MKKTALMVTIFVAASLFVSAQSKNTPPAKQKKDTVRDLQNLRPVHVIENREKRIALQKEQIKRHKEQAKKIKDMQAELDRETNDTH